MLSDLLPLVKLVCDRARGFNEHASLRQYMPMHPLSENSSLSLTRTIRRMGVYLQPSGADDLRQGRSGIREFSYDACGNMTQDASFGRGHSNIYHPKLNLVTAISYRKGADGESAACHEYDYDGLLRPIHRRDSWDVATPATLRDFTSNSRSELLENRISRGELLLPIRQHWQPQDRTGTRRRSNLRIQPAQPVRGYCRGRRTF